VKLPEDSFDAPVIFSLGRWLCRVVLEDFFDLRIFGEENIPSTGPCLIVANHCSFLDPPLLAAGTGRCIYSFARKTLFKSGPWGWIFRRFLTVPVDLDGGSDFAAVKTVLRLLKNDQAVILFPEGTRSPDGKLLPPKRGAGMLAAMTQVPVVPAYIAGTFAAWGKNGGMPCWFSPVRVTYGKVLFPKDYCNSQNPERHLHIANFFMECIASLA
jgi:1-acyl-sn-glycerol-3-phosphate acyltransferase